MPAEQKPATAATALFTFYDIESLANAFTMCAYTPRGEDQLDELEVFYLLDDDELRGQIDHQELYETIVAQNPGLPRVSVGFHDLATPEANTTLAELLGLSDARQVCDKDSPSSYPQDLRPKCDTDSDYDPTKHPFLAGYNSFNYDTTMLARYLAEVFANVVDFRERIKSTRAFVEQAQRSGDPMKIADAQARLQDLQTRGLDFEPVSASLMRKYNDELFTEENIDYMPGALGWTSAAGKIRQSMMRSGRHLDVARLNELQQKVGLKRLLGMLGYQIKESDKLSHDTEITTLEELYELLAYNVSDCLGLSQLFRHPTYSSAFDLKAGLLYQYSETRYAKDGSVRLDRLTIDTSSAKFVGRILSPYGSLDDIESVSYMYPHPEIAKERGIEPVNVLDESVAFFEREVVPDRATNPDQQAAYEQFMEVVAYYREIEGKNFNDSDEYAEKFNLPALSLSDIPKRPNNVPYFRADGTPSSCFATFSYGGIHGAEIDEKSYRAASDEYERQQQMIDRAKRYFPDPAEFIAESRRQRDLLYLPDGTTVDKGLVLYGSDPEKVKYRNPKKDDPVQQEQLARAKAQVPDAADLLATRRPADRELDVVIDDPHGGRFVIEGKVVLAKTSLTSAAYRDRPAKAVGELFPMQDPEGVRTGKVDRSTKLNPKFNHTSAGMVIHEDFTSYYPNLLRNMRAFYNPDLGEDRYAKIFFDKERYGREMKQPGISEAERTRLNTLRNGTKLILNSASGAGDAGHKTPIRMNNRIISMRIIGQLFSWRIGQAQTLAGARIISTNTDGLYSILDEETNNRVLAKEAAAIGVDIEPEPMFLISKDSNNRLELLPPKVNGTRDHTAPVEDWEIATAGGGNLACFQGPRPDKSLAHPAVIDFALARYLKTVAARGEEALSEDFDPQLGRKIIDEALDADDPVTSIKLFQNVLAASRGSITYPFAADPIGRDAEQIEIRNPKALQMINRVLIVKDGTPGAVSLHNAGAWKVSPASQKRRAEDPDAKAVERDEIASAMLRAHGWAAHRWEATQFDLTLLPEDQDVVTRKINSIDPRWSMLILNDDLHAMDTARLREILGYLDLETYVFMLEDTFTKNWKNA